MNIQNILLFILGSFYFMLIIWLGQADTDKTRRKWMNRGGLYFRILRYIFRNRIHFTGKNEPFTYSGITILNANHTHNLDNLVLLACYPGQLEEVASISTLENTGRLDKKILYLNTAITLEKKNITNFIPEFHSKIKQYKRRAYPTTIITYFEGVALNHLKGDPFYPHIGKPQYLAFQMLAEAFPGKPFYDFTLRYRKSNGNILHFHDPYFLWHLISDAKIYIHQRICTFPVKGDSNPNTYLDHLYQEKNTILHDL